MRTVQAFRDAKTRKFVFNMLRWGQLNRRSFPWRETRDPYNVLIAELLLQRTIARQVMPVFSQFLREFPNANVLASAPLDKIRTVISPLGLAYRAARLKSIAAKLVERYGARVPNSEKDLMDLPGVGKYAGNAVLCFAFGLNVPIVDHTIARVVRRVFSFDVGKAPHKNRKLWDFMSRIIPANRARDFNLSILDHAYAVCLPRNPRCDICPISDLCDYYTKLSLPHRLPE